MEDGTAIEESEQHQEAEVAPGLIAVHPEQLSVVVSVGSDLRVYNLKEDCPVSLVDDSNDSVHKDSIRAICYGATGKLFVSSGDDKLVKVWNTSTWHCVCTVSSEKRVSAVAISNDGLFVCFADKFGVVWVVDLVGLQETKTSVDEKAIPLLAHYCSIITILKFSPDGRFIISADRDYKIRVTVFPKNPLHGAHEIQSFCLGHTEYISCLDFVSDSDHPQGFLVSGSGDSTVRLWDFSSGSLLHTREVGGRKAEPLQSNGKGEESLLAVTDLCASPNGSSIAVAIQCSPEIVILSCDLSAKTLSVSKVINISGDNFIPTSLGAASTLKLLWMVMGVSRVPGSTSASLARVRIISGLGGDNPEPHLMEDAGVPGGEQLLQKLQGTLSFEKDVFLTAAEAVKTAMHNLLIKKNYPEENREFKKRGRNDKKLKK